MNIFKRFDSNYLLACAFAAAAVLVMIWIIQLDVDAKAKWSAFVAEYECVIVAKKDSELVTGFSVSPSNGSVSIVQGITDSQTAWKCNDGVTYWK